MNNSNPFIPQGSLLDQKNKRRRRFQVAVLSTFGFSAVLVTGLLMNGGCKQDNSAQDSSGTLIAATNDVTPPPPDTSMAPPLANNQTNLPVAPPPPQPMQPPPPPMPITGSASDYTIVAGDILANIAKSHHTTIKAIEDANPGIVPTKLKVGAIIHLPAPAATAVASNAGMTPMTGTSDGLYTVKSGDTLSKIATAHHTTVKAIRALNATVASTDRIKVGDKLKLPSNSAPAAATADPAPVPPVMPPPPMMSNTAPAPGPGR